MSKPLTKILFNDDAGYPVGAQLHKDGPDAFLASRFGLCAGTQVDSYLWCVPGTGDARAERNFSDPGADPGTVIVDACRKEGMEVFGSLRMNDTHDSGMLMDDPLKLAHPEYLIGEREGLTFGSIMRGMWSGFNYALPEVQEFVFNLIRGECERYNFDGFELDFSRHSLFFKLGEEAENLDSMTGFISRIREMLDDIGQRRGQPYRLSAHLPETPVLARRIGLDMAAWVEKGLLDFVVAGWGYNPYTAAIEDAVELCHGHDVPVYACINCSTVADISGSYAERLRGMATNMLKKGADGIYLFNFFVPMDLNKAEAQDVFGTLDELGSPETLRGKDKIFMYGPLVTWPYMLYSSTVSTFFPLSLSHGGPIELFVGDELEAEARQGAIKEIRLTARVSDIGKDEGVRLIVNGTLVEESGRSMLNEPFLVPPSLHPAMTKPPGYDEYTPAYAIEFLIDAPPITAGTNSVEFLPGRNCHGWWKTRVQEIRLEVNYH